MNFDQFTPIYLIGYAIFVAIRGLYDRAGAGQSSTRRMVDPLEIILLALVALGVMIVPLVAIFTPLMDQFRFSASPTVQSAGAIAMVLSLMLFWLSHVYLGRNFSRTLDIQEGHALVTRGPYRFVRHPMYAAIWLFVIAQALLLPNWVAALSGVAGFAPMYFLRVPREERLMSEQFGSQYEDYQRRTPRLFPRIV